MSSPPTPNLLYDSVQRRSYYLVPRAGGGGNRVYVDSDEPTAVHPPPRTSSRNNPLALPQNTSVTSGVGTGLHTQQVGGLARPRTTPDVRPGSVGGGLPPQPVEPYGAQRAASQQSRGGSGRGSVGYITNQLQRTSVADPGPNNIRHDPRGLSSRAPIYQNALNTTAANQASITTQFGTSGPMSYTQLPQPRPIPQIQRDAGAEINAQGPRSARQITYRPASQNPTAATGTAPGSNLLYANPGSNAYSNPLQAYDMQPQQQNYTNQVTANTQPITPIAYHNYYTPREGVQDPHGQRLPVPQPAYITPQSVARPGGQPGGLPSRAPVPAGQYRNDPSSVGDETVDDDVTDELVRGTEGTIEKLDPNFKVVSDHWHFFVVGRVFIMLSWEGKGQGNPSEGGDGSVQKYVIKTQTQQHGEEVFAKVYRYVVVRPRPKQGYSMCLRISTHGGRGAVGRLINQKEHSIVYTGQRPPAKLPEEKKLNKEPLQVEPVDSSMQLEALSRIHYAKPYPVEHNVKVREVGMVAARDLRRLGAYYQMESGYETEREPPREPHRRARRDSEAHPSREAGNERRAEPRRENRRRGH